VVLLFSFQLKTEEPINFVYVAEDRDVFPYFVGDWTDIPNSKQFVKKHPKLSAKIWRVSNEVAIKHYPSIAKKYTK